VEDVPTSTRAKDATWPLIAVVFVAWLTLHSLVIWPDAAERSGFDPPFSAAWQAIALFALMGVSALGSIGVALMFTLRKELEITPDARPKIAYAAAVAPALYGLVTAMFTGRPVLYVPFGAVALATLAAVYVLGRRQSA
jgi:hypothetical protein